VNKIFFIVLFVLSYWLGSALVGYKHQGYYIASDGEGYYMYLPAMFIYGTFEDIPVLTPYEFKPYPGTKKITTRFTYGVALMEAPFFGIAQLSRKIQGYKTDHPFTNDISVMLLVAGCFYTTLGLFFVYKTLSRLFENKKVVWWSVIILYFGTNLMFYAIREPTMSHAYSFCLIAALTYVLPAFWKGLMNAGSVSRTILVGFLLGLIVLIRPTNILIALLVLLYDVYSLSDFKNRLSFIIKNLKTLWIIPFIALLLAIPQMMYWHYLSGRWVMNIYKEIHNATFALWDKPELFKVFFHPCNGFLFYSPLMGFTLLGMAWMAFKNQLNGRVIGVLFLVFAYMYASWFMWSFGHAFGYRSFIDYYPLMVFGLAFYINELMKSKMIWFKYLNFAIFIALIIINFRFTIIPFYWQVEADGRNMDDFSKAWNWVFDFTKWIVQR
jgi:hypothetical protein